MSKKPGSGAAGEGAGPEGLWDEFQRKASQAWQDWAGQTQAAASGEAAGGEWAERIRAGLDGYYGWLGQLGTATAGGPQPSAGASADQAPWAAWIEAMQRGDFKTLQALLMQTPGLGSGRVEQERQKALIAAWMDYLAASQAYEALVRRSQIRGGEVLRERLDRLCAENGSFESLRQIYDEWIDSAEAAYMDVALSEEFSRAYGALVNAQVRLRQLQREHVEQQARTWGLPVSGDVEALGERVESLRRELRQAQLKIATLEGRLDGRAGSTATKPEPGATVAAAAKPARTKASKTTPRAAAKPAAKARPKRAAAQAAAPAVEPVAITASTRRAKPTAPARSRG